MSKDLSAVRKGWRANAKVSDAVSLAHDASYPAIVGARFALVLSLLSFVLAAIALAVAVAK
jgi:hypothetical protein